MAFDLMSVVCTSLAVAFAALLLQGCGKLPIIPPGFTNTTCAKDTSGTCMIGGCSKHRGPTDCLNSKCMCQFGFCAVNGECVSSCETATTGTCSLLGCKSKRGPTDCVSGKCVCKPGYCADRSKFACSLPCEVDTYGSCRVLGCSNSRGPTTCSNGKCLCEPGYCSEAGVCVATPTIATNFAEEISQGRAASVPKEPSYVPAEASIGLQGQALAMVVAGGVGVVAALFSISVFIMRRRRGSQEGYASLLAGAES